MSVVHLPKSITKDVLFKRAVERFKDWVRMYDDPTISATYMYEDMAASCYCGCPADDFPDDFNKEPEKPVKVSGNEFKYRDVTFRITCDKTDDKSYIWCGTCGTYDTLVEWVWGSVFAGDTWLIGTDILDKFIDAHKKEEC